MNIINSNSVAHTLRLGLRLPLSLQILYMCENGNGGLQKRLHFTGASCNRLVHTLSGSLFPVLDGGVVHWTCEGEVQFRGPAYLDSPASHCSALFQSTCFFLPWGLAVPGLRWHM